VRSAGASYQRGRPESAMERFQEAYGGGVLPHALEHIGDLTHRMNEGGGRFGSEFVAPKIDSMRSSLNHPYGFEREMGEQMRENTRYRGTDLGSQEQVIESLGKAYSDEHRKVPVYNFPSEVARDAAVSVGEGRFNDTRRHMDHLSVMEFGGRDPDGQTWAPRDMHDLLKARSPEENQQGMVDYLRDKESRTPEFTNAARSMLGGPP
jgi:hypothetical protein